MIGRIVERDVEAFGTLTEGGDDGRAIARVRDDHELVGAVTVDDDVVDDAAVGVEHQRVLGLVVDERRETAGEGIVEERAGVGALHEDLRHV